MDENPDQRNDGKGGRKLEGELRDRIDTANGEYDAIDGNISALDDKVDGELLARYTSAREYDEGRFWRTVGRHAAKWGGKLLEQILTLYYCMIDPATPARSKTIIAGAIAYTVLPTDLIPDLIPAVGWTDDAAMITWAGVEVVGSIKEEHRRRARERVASLLGRRLPEPGAAHSSRGGDDRDDRPVR